MAPGGTSPMAGNAGDTFAPGLFAGRHVAVTGGGSGIGAAIAAAFARLGASLTLIGRRAALLEAQAAALCRDGVAVQCFPCDATRPEAVERSFAAAAAGLGPIAVLVNNAGAVESRPFARIDPDSLERALAVNLKQAFYCSQAVLPAMREAGFGRIVNIASTASLTGYAYLAAYCAAKHGMLGLTRALAIELVRSGITVNAICPGYTETPLVEGAIERVHEKTGRDREALRQDFTSVSPLGRMIRPEEVASAAVWLALPASAGVTGQSVVVAGGEILAR